MVLFNLLTILRVLLLSLISSVVVSIEGVILTSVGGTKSPLGMVWV